MWRKWVLLGAATALLCAVVVVYAIVRSGPPRGPFQDCAACPVMVSIPAGSFIMGVAPDEQQREHVPEIFRPWSRPQRSVTVKTGFAIGKYHVTRGEFAVFAAETGHVPTTGCIVYFEKEMEFMHQPGNGWHNPRFTQTDRDPVVCVSWYDAQAYAAWLSKKTGHRYRLPTEAEWEYAARAGTTGAQHWGEDRSAACRHANGADLTMFHALALQRDRYRRAPDRKFDCTDGYVYTSPAGSFGANAFGLHDMLGNAWQWVEDCETKSYEGAPSDSRAWTEGNCRQRGARGGAWYSLPFGVRSGERNWDPPEVRYSDNGFRVARDL